MNSCCSYRKSEIPIGNFVRKRRKCIIVGTESVCGKVRVRLPVSHVKAEVWFKVVVTHFNASIKASHAKILKFPQYSRQIKCTKDFQDFFLLILFIIQFGNWRIVGTGTAYVSMKRQFYQISRCFEKLKTNSSKQVEVYFKSRFSSDNSVKIMQKILNEIWIKLATTVNAFHIEASRVTITFLQLRNDQMCA